MAGQSFRVVKTEAQWKQILNPMQFAVLRQAATERPFSSPLNAEHHHGVFRCASVLTTRKLCCGPAMA